MKKLSIVIPVYQNELNLPDTIPQILKLKEKLENYDLELIFVDDGSTDKSFEILKKFKEANQNIIKIIKLTRNFGSHMAIKAGLSEATGDCVGIQTADLQDPPELLLGMLKHWENGTKAIFGVRADRKDPIPSKIASKIYYTLLRKFALKNYPNGGFDTTLIDKQVVNELKKIKDSNINLLSLVFWLGFEYVTIPYIRQKREKGKSQWTFSKKIKLVIDTFVGFSYTPIRLISITGTIIALISFGYGIFILYNWLNGFIEVEGWTSTMVVLTFTAGIQMIMLGVIGEYLWRVLAESRNRPSYVIDKVL